MIIQNGSPLRTFVVEGQALIAKALRSFLNQNSAIRMVGDAPSVRVEDLERARPDLIVYGLDNAAHTVSEALAMARSVLPNVRLCVLSSFPDPEIMQRSIASGADGFVVKAKVKFSGLSFEVSQIERSAQSSSLPRRPSKIIITGSIIN